MFLLSDSDYPTIYGIFENKDLAEKALAEMAAIELEYFLSIAGDVREEYFTFYAEPNAEEIDPNSAGYQEMLEEWKKGYEITELPINILQLPGYIKENKQWMTI